MKKKSIACVAVSAACVSLALCACGGLGSFVDTDKLASDAAKGDYKFDLVGSLDGYTVTDSDSTTYTGLVKFIKVDGGNTSTVVYDLKNNKTVLTKTTNSNTSYSVEIKEVGAISVTASIDGVDTCSYYTRGGTAIVENSKIAEFKNGNTVINGTKVYRVDENTGELADTYDIAATATVPNVDRYMNGYYFNDDDGTISMYDSRYNLNGTWVAPGNARSLKTFYLQDGTVIAQYREMLPDDEEDYDLFVSGSKYNLHHVRINPKNGSAKEFDADYEIQYAYAVPDYLRESGYMKDSVKNYAEAAMIEDHALASESHMYAMTNNGKLDFRIDEYKGNDATFRMLGNGYMTASLKYSGQVLLLDSELNEIGDISGVPQSQVLGKYLVMNGNGIYDYSLNRVVDLTESKYAEYRYSTSVDGYPVFSTNDSYYIYNNGFKALENYSGVDARNLVYNSNGDYYTAGGTKICTANRFSYTAELPDGTMLYMGTLSSGVNVYYRATRG